MESGTVAGMTADPERETAALAAALASAGYAFTSRALADLLRGVLAAPEPIDPEAWLALVGADLPANLRDRLRTLKSDLAATASDPEGESGNAAAGKLAALRAELRRRGLGGFVVPRADEHQGESVPARAERLAWLTGFTGSAGIAVVLRGQAAVFVDGRYTLQVERQVDRTLYSTHHLIEEPPHEWLASRFGEGGTLGYDPWLHTRAQVKRLRAAVETAGASLVACDGNPLDAVWVDQPGPPVAPVLPLAPEYCGRGPAEKRRDVARALADKGAAAAVLTQPDSIAWLLNVRGGDVARTPLPLSFALLHEDATVEWFLDPRKVTGPLERHLGNAVTLRAPADLGPALDALGAARKRVLADPASAAAWLFGRLEAAGAVPVGGADPCQLPKARKNAVEIDGSRRAHRRDGRALTRFLCWFAREAPARAAGGAGLDERQAADRLLAFRRENEAFRDLSFDTISGAGPNGAVVHYRVTEETSRSLALGDLYLVDSGAQYLDGTTDVTRTVAVGAPDDEMRARFTLVLKGHIALATARFPRGTSGGQLDALARMPLWRAGLDYDHGTGHGVGSYLGVHEGPQRISKAPNTVGLEPGMIVSNEPGYYKTGAYGIRIENLVTVVESPKQEGEERDMLAFETLTLAPIDLNLVEPALLGPDELAWLNAYHARVREAFEGDLDGEEAAWLAEATRAL